MSLYVIFSLPKLHLYFDFSPIPIRICLLICSEIFDYVQSLTLYFFGDMLTKDVKTIYSVLSQNRMKMIGGTQNEIL